MNGQNNFNGLDLVLAAIFFGGDILVTEMTCVARHTDGSGETTLNYGVSPLGQTVLVSVDKVENLPQEVEIDCPSGGDHTHRLALCAPGASHYHNVG